MNAKIDDGSDVAELMYIFKEQNAYDFEKFPKTSTRKQHFLVGEGGKEQMCEAVESYARQVAEEQAERHARKFFESGVSFEVVKKSIDSLTEEVLRRIYEEVMSKTE